MAAVASAHPDDVLSIREQVSEEEWEARVNLAACYRLVDHYDMSDLLGTHISARVPGEDNTFLLNPYGMYFDEITASSLIKVDYDGNVLTETPFDLNLAGFTIHSAVMMGRPDVDCALHTHTRAGMAVSALNVACFPCLSILRVLSTVPVTMTTKASRMTTMSASGCNGILVIIWRLFCVITDYSPAVTISVMHFG